MRVSILILSIFACLDSFANTELINCRLDDSHQYKVVQKSEIELQYFKNGNLDEVTVLQPKLDYAEFEFKQYNRLEAYVFRATKIDPNLIKTTREARLFGSKSTFLINYFDKNDKALVGAIYIRNGMPMICASVTI